MLRIIQFRHNEDSLYTVTVRVAWLDAAEGEVDVGAGALSIWSTRHPLSKDRRYALLSRRPGRPCVLCVICTRLRVRLIDR